MRVKVSLFSVRPETREGTASSRAVTANPQPRARFAFAQGRLMDAVPSRNHQEFFLRRSAQLITLVLAVLAFLGAGDQSARVNDLGHRMMCVCGCNQILLECNHVGCAYSDRMRAELIAAVDRGDNDDLTLQGFVQKYGTTVMAAPTKTGFNRVAWIMPYLVLVLGLATVTLIVRAWRSRPLVLPAGAVAAVHGAELEHFRDQARKDTEV
jgi:cytochrome c-type biogenesis protein CcmH/NrfF